MKTTIALVALAGCLVGAALWSGRKASANADAANLPVYTSDGKLALPANYRDWVFLTSGFGMNYANGTGNNPMFTNVYVAPEAYRGFKSSGKWPDKSMFIVEIYSPASHGSINKGGHYQDTYQGLDVEVKDSSRPKEWSYYNFSAGETAGELEGAGCNNCHSQHAAVENTFVQFYPTLLDFALEKGLVKSSVSIPLNESRFLKILNTSGWDKAQAAYDQDRKKNPDSDLLNEHALNVMGYNLLRHKKTSDAVSVFKLATRDYSNSVNAYDSLGDAYAEAAQSDLAIAASQKELALAQSDSSLSPDRKKQFTELAQKRIEAMSKH
jgi:hypothetical protein